MATGAEITRNQGVQHTDGRAVPPLAFVIMFGVALVLGACSRTNPKYCVENGECGVAHLCSHNECIPGTPDAAGAGGTGGRRGSGGSGANPDPTPTDAGAGAGEGGLSPNDLDATVSGGPDLPAVDLGPPVECKFDTDCTKEGQKLCVDNKCRACTQANTAGCPPERPFCSNANGCVGCNERKLEDPNVCKLPLAACAPEGWCAECNSFADCTDASKPLCAAVAGAAMPKSCAGCMMGEGSAGCKAKNPALPVCLPTGQCAECNVSSDCPMLKVGICVANKCMPCTTDDQCAARGDGPGVCLVEPDARSGRCASDPESIYVALAGCSDGDKGVAAKPFCSMQKAIDTVSKDRRVVVVRSGSFNGFRIDKADKAGDPIWIVGLKNNGDVVINPGGAATGIVISKVAVDVRLRGLTIRNSEDVGVRAEGGSTIVRLNRCILDGNRQGGFSATMDAGFDVSNSVFVGNGAGGAVGGAAFGGAFLSPPKSKIARFRASTVLNNASGGVVCAVPNTITLTGVLLWGNEAIACKPLVDSRTGVEPLLSTANPYHLTIDSPCRNVLPSGSAPLEDLDGDLRKSGNTDCGADEYKP